MENKVQAYRYGETRRKVPLDPGIIFPAILLAAMGLVMVGSASIAIAEEQSLSTYHYLVRHPMYLGLGVLLAMVFRVISTRHLEYISQPMMLIGLLLLCTVFIPGLGKTVNGSTRWIDLGLANFQVVEAAKLALIIYMAGYLVKRGEMIRNRFFDTLKPLLIAGVYTLVLLLQPDLGSAVVITLIIGGMVWLAGAAWRHIFILAALASPAFALAAMEPYRFRRIISFMDPWADPFNSGFQLTQALIAIGRGELMGVGLGASIQKLYYLPEAHTDFIFAVLAEELGLIGVVFVLALFAILVGRILIIGCIAQRRGKPFAGYLAWGVGLWIGLQALISMGVNMGLLPTKGITLPLISSGGSSVLITCVIIGLVLRIKYELDREVEPMSLARQQRAVS
jgi:cell division protein FtsW